MKSLSTLLMIFAFFGALTLLFLIRNGRTYHLAGLRFCIRYVALIPILGIIFNYLSTIQTFLSPMHFTSFRLCIGYTIINLAVWSFVIWLLRLPPSSSHQAAHQDSPKEEPH